jgi:hypothetical protein
MSRRRRAGALLAVGLSALAVAPAQGHASALSTDLEILDYKPVTCMDECYINVPTVPNYKTLISSGTTTVLKAAQGPVATVTTLTKALTGQTLTQNGTGQNVGGAGGLGRTNLSVECTAVGTPAIAVGITSCYARGANGAVYHVPRTGAKPGPGDTSVGAVLDVPAQSYQVCVASQAVMQDNRYITAPTACSG